MHGVLVATDRNHRRMTLRAVSGLDESRSGTSHTAAAASAAASATGGEQTALRQLSRLSRAIERLDVAGARARLAVARAPFDRELAALLAQRQSSRRRRRELRAAAAALPPPARADRLLALDRESQRERSAIKAMRAERDRVVAVLATELEDRLQRRGELRNRRRRLSRRLQSAMHASRGFINFAGRHAGLGELFGAAGIPSGSGECCGPKLLQEAAQRCLRPLAIAEFWWGEPSADGARQPRHFYGPCAMRCQPLLGHLLCGADAPRPILEMAYSDDDFVVVDKPAGLRSVPGRGSAGQDCAQSRLAGMLPGDGFLRAVHRLDQATSGLLIIARNPTAHRRLAAQFAAATVHKEYIAVVGTYVGPDRGDIRLRLRADLADRPRQVVDERGGRDAHTSFRVIGRHGAMHTRLALCPHSGRTHQLRVHCASGMAAPIVGDTLYGGEPGERLLLHASLLEFAHPSHGTPMTVTSPAPF